MSSSTTTTVIMLSSFSSLIEVSVAINLVFSIWETLRLKAINRLNSKVEDFYEELSVILATPCSSESRSSVSVEKKAQKYKKRLEKLANIAQATGLIISTILIICLIVLGFKDISLTDTQAWMFSFFCVGPSALLIIVGNLYSSFCVQRLGEDVENKKDSLIDAKRMLGDSYSSN